MSELLTVPSPFPDIAALAEGYVEQVTPESVRFATPEPVAEGDYTQFVVLLADGTPAFAGTGRALQVVDQGNEAPPEQRFGIWLDTLQFEEDSQRVFDYLVAIAQQAQEQAPPVEDDWHQSFSERPDEGNGPQAATYAHEGQAQLESFEASAEGYETSVEAYEASAEVHEVPAPSVEPEPYGDAEAAGPDSVLPEPAARVLSRPSLGTHWRMRVPPPGEPRPGSGLFVFGVSGLPTPPAPPRPDIDPSQRVSPAPAAHATAGAQSEVYDDSADDSEPLGVAGGGATSDGTPSAAAPSDVQAIYGDPEE